MTTGPLEIIGGKILAPTLIAAVKRAHAEYQERAKNILVDELAKGNRTIADIAENDEAAARIFLYSEAATKGKARRNLRLLAQLLAAETVAPDTYPDEFTEFFDLLADLSRLEIVVLSRYHKMYSQVADAPPIGA